MSSGAEPNTGHDAGTAPRSRDGSAGDAEDVLRQLPETLVRYDSAERIVFVNDEFVARTGHAPTDVIGKRAFEWADGGQSLYPDVNEYRRVLREVLTTGEPRQTERVRSTPSGDPEVFRVLFRAERDADGAIVGAFAIAHNITDLARTRRMLAAREQQFQVLAENLPEVLIRFDTTGRVVYTNRHYSEQVGGPAIVGRLIDDLDPMGATGAGFRAAVRRALTAGEPGRVKVVTRISPSHPPLTHSILVQPEFDRDGSVSGAIAIGHDVTELDEARAGAARSELRFRSLAEHLPDVVVRFDADGRATYVNRSLGVPGGRDPSALVGLTLADVGDRLVEYERLVRDVLATGDPASITVSFAAAGGVGERLYSVLIAAEHSEGGEVVGAIAIARDVTDLVRAEQDAEARAFEFVSLAENLPDLVVRYDLDARVTYINRAPETELAMPPESIVGRTPTELAPAGITAIDEYELTLRGVIASGEPASIDISFHATDGSERVRNVLLRAERLSTGEIVGAIAIARDITDRVRAEHEAAERAHEFKTLAENLPDLVARYDLEARATYVNRTPDIPGAVSAHEAIGLTPSESAAQGLVGIEEYEATLRRVLATGDAAATDLLYVDADGHERVHNVVFRAERSAAGDIVGAIAIGRDVTDLVLAHREIAAREHQYRTLAENLPDMVLRYDREGRATYIAAQFAEGANTDIADEIGRRPTEIQPPGMLGLEEYEQRLLEVIATGQPSEAEIKLLDADGEQRVHSVLIRAERGDDQTITGALAIGRDVTDRVRAEEAAEARAREFRTLAENMPDIVLRYDTDGRTVYVNPQHDEQVNMARSELLGRRPTEIPFDGMTGVEAYEQTLMQVLATGRPAQSEIELTDASGERRVHNVLFRAERSSAGEIIGAIAIGRDVTDLVRAEEAAEARAREFRTLAENLPDVVLRYDSSVRLLYANRRIELPDDHAISDMIGHTPTEGAPVAAGPQAEFEGALRRVIATGMPESIETELVDSAGDERVHNVLIHPERSSTDEIIGAVAIGRDVTDLVRAERAAEERAREFRSLAENLPDLVIRYDLDARATYANQILPFATGPSTASDLIGRTPLEVETSDLQGLGEYERALREVLTTGESVTTELVFTDAAGAEHVRSVVLAPERDGDGTIVGAISIGRDVTDLVQAQQHATAREREFRTLAENATDFIGRWDRESRRIYTNPALARLLGQPPEDLIGHIADGGPDGAFNEFVAAVRATIEQQTERTVLQRFVDPGGEERIHEVKLLPEHDEHGEFISVLGIGRDITEVIRQREALEEAARTDALTGVASRKVLYEALPRLLTSRAAEGRRVAVLLLDLDGFKTINDQHGHGVGDQMLRQIAARLATCLGPDDMLVRVGGDEFVIVLGDAEGPSDASVLAHQARMLVTELKSDGPVRFPAVDASVGIAVFPDHGDDTDVLFAHADLALYEAKRSGRGRVHFFHSELRDAMERRSAIEQALYECVPDTEMTVHLQPICSLGADPHVWGAEALVRWNHPRLGSISPAEFIPIAEHSGEIVPIGRWVLRRAAELAVGLNTGRPRPLRVSVNVSTRQFALDDVAEATRGVLETTGCDPRWLILEITENLLLEELQRVDRTLESLRALGVSIAIDDFGTGYSSLHYLTRLRVDHMKVDKSFVRDADVDHQQQEVVRALVAMAQALGIGVVAEGIETPGQACLLEQLGCHLGQGYLLAQPMPIEQFASWLTDAHTTLPA